MRERIGKYHVIRAAGSGGFGTVYEGYDVELDRNVAIKICTTGDEGQLQRFRREARIVSQLKHRNVALVHDYGFDAAAGLHFLVEEFLSGVDLERKIQDRDALPASLRLRYLMDIAQGLLFVHDRGLIHRDLSPRNIRVLHDHSIKIMDFGLAKDATDSTLTLVGDNFGTVGYTAPEQITGMRTVDHRTDIFSYGVIAYELLTWSNPFKAESMGEFIHRIHHVEPEPIDEVWRGCPRELAQVVHRCMRKAADERFDSCAEILPVLKKTLRFLRDYEIPSPLGTRSVAASTALVPPGAGGVEVVGGDIQLEGGSVAPARVADQRLATVGLDDDRAEVSDAPAAFPAVDAKAVDSREVSPARRRHLLPGIAAATLILAFVAALFFSKASREAAPAEAAAPVRSAPPLSAPAPPPPPPAEDGFTVLARSTGSAEQPVIVLAAQLPRLANLSHCYVVRSPAWSYGEKIRHDCGGESFLHSDRLEVVARISYTYRILLADSAGKILDEAMSLPVTAGE